MSRPMPDIDREKVACTGCGKLEYYYLTHKGLCHACMVEREIESTERYYGRER